MSECSILVVDDEPNNFEVVEALLAAEDYNVYYASNGQEALASLDAFDPDLILLDLIMPEMDGLEVCERIKLTRKWRSIPIIMLTALPGETAIVKCLQAGADDFINKPVQGTELRARVKSMLRIKKQFDRIESFTRLQQNKISLLENDLVELGADLAIGFANELNTPLHNVIDRLEDLSQKVRSNEDLELLALINSGRNSALNLEQLTNKFWIYIELALEKKPFVNGENCDIKKMVEQIAKLQLQASNREHELSIELENANLAITVQHCEWIVKELLENALQFSLAGNPVKISGWVADQQFHLQVRDQLPNDLSNGLQEEQELVLSLKIVKRIVNIYDGMFYFSNTDLSNRKIHITLPLDKG